MFFGKKKYFWSAVITLALIFAACDLESGNSGSGNQGGGNPGSGNSGGGNQGSGNPGGGVTIPVPPINVKAIPLSPNSISITWNKVDDATSYVVYFKTGSLQITELTTVSGNSHTDTDLQPNTEYTYYIVARNISGSSAYSSPDSATTHPASGGTDVVTNPFIGSWYGKWKDGGDQQVILIFQESFYSWTLPSGDGWGFSGLYTYSGNNATLHGDMPGTAEIRGNSLILKCDYFGGNGEVICTK